MAKCQSHKEHQIKKSQKYSNFTPILYIFTFNRNPKLKTSSGKKNKKGPKISKDSLQIHQKSEPGMHIPTYSTEPSCALKVSEDAACDQ